MLTEIVEREIGEPKTLADFIEQLDGLVQIRKSHQRAAVERARENDDDKRLAAATSARIADGRAAVGRRIRVKTFIAAKLGA